MDPPIDPAPDNTPPGDGSEPPPIMSAVYEGEGTEPAETTEERKEKDPSAEGIPDSQPKTKTPPDDVKVSNPVPVVVVTSSPDPATVPLPPPKILTPRAVVPPGEPAVTTRRLGTTSVSSQCRLLRPLVEPRPASAQPSSGTTIPLPRTERPPFNPTTMYSRPIDRIPEFVPARLAPIPDPPPRPIPTYYFRGESHRNLNERKNPAKLCYNLSFLSWFHLLSSSSVIYFNVLDMQEDEETLSAYSDPSTTHCDNNVQTDGVEFFPTLPPHFAPQAPWQLQVQQPIPPVIVGPHYVILFNQGFNQMSPNVMANFPLGQYKPSGQFDPSTLGIPGYGKISISLVSTLHFASGHNLS